MPVTLTKNQKRGLILSHDEFMYYLVTKSEGKVLWRCSKYGRTSHGYCYTTIAAPEGEVLSIKEHKHAGVAGEIEPKVVKAKINDRAVSTHDGPSKILAKPLEGASASASGCLLNLESLAKTARNRQAINNPTPPEPTSAQDLIVSGSYSQTTKNEPFLMYDSKNENRILIFFTEYNLNTLASCDTWLPDGTFQVSPLNFQQLYTIHGLKDGKVLPLVYMMCKKKSKKTYITVLRKLKELNPGLSLLDC
ncbi:uncharacterized protein LOC107041851 [Diachasma alloeum]|uniref:uncharacterized protein LOC107041851 n=1 Tax=Diachasma alloeum TaxID=454923 RepID=UPI0007381BF9|nr:uncharacterized protein LOC107041851 [Diachasma alloeum]